MRLCPPALSAVPLALQAAVLWWVAGQAAQAQSDRPPPAPHISARHAETPHAPAHAEPPYGAIASCELRTLPPPVARSAVEGEVVQAIGCRDQDGEHWFLETRQTVTSPGARAPRVALTFIKYSLHPSGKSARRWQARDFADPSASPGPLPSARLLVRDVDQDGRVEAFIAYTLPRPDAGVDDGKLLVFYKDRKYAIRGAVALRPGDFASRTLDADFGTLPAPVQQTALGLWDRLALPAAATGSAAPGFALIRGVPPARR